MASIDTTPLSPGKLSHRLLECTKKGNTKEALTLLENGANPNLADQVGNTSMHLAALGGYTDLIIKMVQKNGNARKMDDNGETPLHKAARKGHVEIIIILMASGGDINTLNMLGQAALELAVIAREIKAVEICCKLGSECVLQNWTWVTNDVSKLSKKEQQIFEILVDQSCRYPGFKYGAINFEVLQLQQCSSGILENPIDISINTDHIRDSFFLYCGKIHPEYTELAYYLKEDESIFSDVYEFMAWGKTASSLTIQMTIPGVPACSELLKIKGLEGFGKGKIDGFEIVDSGDPDGTNHTKVTVTFSLRKASSVTFCIVTTDHPESFTVSGSAVVIQPSMEPEAKINIPEGAFEGQGQLQVNVAETKPVLRDDTDSLEPLLVTNIIDLTMSDGMQPKKAVKLKLPIHSDTMEDIVILASTVDDPEDEDDWECIPTEKDNKMVSFEVNHFSFYVAGSKAQLKRAAELACQAIRKERRIELFAMTKYETEKTSTIVVECCLKRAGKKRRKKWKEKGFEPQTPEFFECFVNPQQRFKLVFPESLPVQDATDEIILIFNPRKKKTYMTFGLAHENELPCGDVTIDLVLECDMKKPNPAELKKNKKKRILSFVCGSDSDVIEPVSNHLDEPTEKLEHLTALSVVVQQPANEASGSDNDEETSKVSAEDPNCSIKCTVLRYSSLRKLAERLTEAETYSLGVNLALRPDVLNELKKKEKFKDLVFSQWRPKRPYEQLVLTLIQALERIDRRDLADMIRTAYDKQSEFKYICKDDDDD